jgi:hypothetical protein
LARCIINATRSSSLVSLSKSVANATSSMNSDKAPRAPSISFLTFGKVLDSV